MPRRSRQNFPNITKGPHRFAFLAAWREHARLTQENVGETLRVTGVTVHRWETGKVAVSTKTWFDLAQLYGATHPSQLWFPPHLRDRAAALESAWAVIATLPHDQLERWIATGLDLARGADKPAAEDLVRDPGLLGHLHHKK